MKRISWRPAPFIVIFAIVTLGLSTTASRYLRSTQIDVTDKNVSTLAEDDPSPATSVATNQRDSRSAESSITLTNKAPALFDLEKVEVIARSISFPSVLRKGALLIDFKYPNAQLFCVDAAYYAGRAMGLILAMDRTTVHEHALYWTIDLAAEVFDECQLVLLQHDVVGQYAAGRTRASKSQAEIVERIAVIQEELKYAERVEFQISECSASVGLTDTMPSLAR